MRKLIPADYTALIISVHKTFAGLIYLLLFKLINIKCLDQCTLETASLVPNICDRSDNIVHASETDIGCSLAGSKCWCILIDNRNRVYDGAMVVELVQIFDNSNSYSDEIQFSQIKSYLTFRIVPGLNRIFVQPYTPPEALTNITSIKIHQSEICKFGKTPPLLNSSFSDNNYEQPANNSDINSDFFTDCMNRVYYTDNSHKYCSTYRPEFMIEKRFTLDNRLYWCIIINNDNYLLTSLNRLHIAYSSPNRYFVYSPIDAYTEREIAGSDFQLGNRRTIIAISKLYNHLANLNSITIDNQPICSYFEPPVTTNIEQNPVQILDQPDLPAVLMIPANLSFEKSNIDIVAYPPIILQPNPPITPFIDVKTCGIKQIHPNPLISYGSNTKPGDWPWHAAIYRLKSRTTNRNFICGGTLINRKAIVTAAHCVIEFNLVVISERLIVELGRYDLNHATAATQEYSIFDIIPHEYYNPDTLENDIALLILANYVKESPSINFICLPSPELVLHNQVGTAVGWGTDSNNKLQIELKAAPFLVVEDITCLESNRDFFAQYLTSTNFCAGYRNNTNVCRGDSGGGLVFKHKDSWFLGGVTSFGVSLKSVEHECDISQYVIFTNVIKFLAWIKQNS